MTKLVLLSFFFLSGVETYSAVAKNSWQTDLSKSESAVDFLAVGKPSAIKIRGKGAGLEGVLTGEDSKISGTIAVNLEKFDTGIGLRNQHMKEKYLEVAKFPKAILSNINIELGDFFNSDKLSKKGIPFEANLELHGVKNPVKGTADIERSGFDAKLKSQFKIKLSDYKIDVPKYMGITVAEDVDVNVEAKIPVTKK